MKYLLLLLVSFNIFADTEIGFRANDIPLNQFLGSMAFESVKNYTPFCHALGVPSAGTTVTNAGTFVAVNFQTASAARGGCTTVTGSSTFTSPVTGYYEVCAHVEFTSQTYAAGNIIQLKTYVDGVASKRMDYKHIEAIFTGIVSLGGLCSTELLTFGQVLTIQVSNNRTAGNTDTTTDSWVTVKRLSE